MNYRGDAVPTTSHSKRSLCGIARILAYTLRTCAAHVMTRHQFNNTGDEAPEARCYTADVPYKCSKSFVQAFEIKAEPATSGTLPPVTCINAVIIKERIVSWFSHEARFT